MLLIATTTWQTIGFTVWAILAVIAAINFLVKIYKEHFEDATIIIVPVIIGTAVVFYLTQSVNPLLLPAWCWQHKVMTCFVVMGYLLLGLIVSALKLHNLAASRWRELLEIRNQWTQDYHGWDSGDGVVYPQMRRFNDPLPDVYRPYWTEFVRTDRSEAARNARKLSEPLRFSTYSNKLGWWVAYWPAYVVNWFVEHIIGNFFGVFCTRFRFLYEAIVGFHQRRINQDFVALNAKPESVQELP